MGFGIESFGGRALMAYGIPFRPDNLQGFHAWIDAMLQLAMG